MASVSLNDSETEIARSDDELVVQATNHVTHCPIWFKTGPLDEDFLNDICKIQLVTESHDQGWVSDPSVGTWTWFELAVFENVTSQIPKVRDGEPLVWRSHSNPQAVGLRETHVGAILDRQPGSILNDVKVGNVIGVRVCAQFSGWCNHAYTGRLVATFNEKHESHAITNVDPSDGVKPGVHSLSQSSAGSPNEPSFFSRFIAKLKSWSPI